MIPGVKALTFDTGGTILDWHRGVAAALAAAGKRRGIAADWAEATNEYRRRALKGMTRQVVNAGAKMHRLAGVKVRHG